MVELLKAPRAIRTAFEPIRISFVIDDLSRAGTETQLLALIRNLDRGEFEPSLILLNGDGVESRKLEPSDCPILRLGIRKLISPSALMAAAKLRSFWKTHRPSIAQVYFHDSAYFAVPLAKLVGVKHILRVRNNLGYNLTRRDRWMNRLIRPAVNGYLTNSELGREAIRSNEQIAADRVQVLENGVDLDRYPVRRNRHVGGRIRIGCVANLRPVKNIAGLMRVAKRLRERFPQVAFEVAGEGEQRGELEALHRELNLGEGFLLRGAISDVPSFLASCDLAVQPSHSESLSNAVLEYLASGLPVVATDVGANKHLLSDGAGVIVPPGNETALFEALENLLNRPGDWNRLGRVGRGFVERDYSRAAMVERFQNFYRGLLGWAAT